VEHPYNGINTPEGRAIRGRSAEGSSYSWIIEGDEEVESPPSPGDRGARRSSGLERYGGTVGQSGQGDVNERKEIGKTRTVSYTRTRMLER
jgi:hypothetical protein